MDKSKLHDTDSLMETTFKLLAHDMHRCLEISGKSPYAESAKISRERSILLHDNMPAYTYKWCAQLSSFLKRYTFQNDLLSSTQREEATNVKFIELQTSLASVYWRQRSTRLHQLLTRARFHACRILRGYSPTCLEYKGKFGTKATVGCARNSAYIDTKLCERPITGSAVHLAWFKNDYVAGDELLAKIITASKFEVITKLSQVNVPKKYNIDRGINPNTLVGSLHSSALGTILTEALKHEGLDISRLQNRHARLVKRISMAPKPNLATADLSNASHGFLSHHLNALLPREWYRACMTGVIRQVEVGQRTIRLESIMTMGIGFTFPMQTLLFYCLLRALQDLTHTPGLISVYGDDLIYPVKLHSYVVKIFSEMGFSLNLDKTFVQSPFRESCGSDWFKGVDVRPFSPEGQASRLSNVAYAAFCFKLINGLLRRWTLHEVVTCVSYLKNEVSSAIGAIFYVPMNYADYAGIKVPDPRWYIEDAYEQWCHPVVPVHLKYGEGTVYGTLYTSITITNQRRYVRNHSPYYWEWLRSRACRPTSDSPNLPLIIDTPVFKWSVSRSPRTVRLLSGRVVRRKDAFVTNLQYDEQARYEVTTKNAV